MPKEYTFDEFSGGKPISVSSPSEPINVSAPKDMSFLESIASSPLKLGVTATKAAAGVAGLGAEGVGRLVGSERLTRGGRILSEKAAETEPVDFGPFGKVRPLGISETGEKMSDIETVKQAIGGGVELGTYFVGLPEAKAGITALKGGITKQLVKQGAKEGAILGGLGSAGMEAGKGEATAGEIAGTGLIGSILGFGIGAGVPIATRAIKGTVGKVKSIVNPEVEEAFVRAIKPGKNNVNFTSDLKTALPEVADTLKLKGIEPGKVTINDFDKAITETKKRVWDRYEKVLSPNAHVEIDTNPIADALESSITKRFEMQNPAKAESIRELATAYRNKKMTVGEAEDFLREANAELHSYYAKNKVGRAVAVSDPEVMAVLKEAEGLRTQLYGKLDELTGGESAEIKKLYGALTNVGNEVSGRAQVFNRQAPATLQETIHYPLAVARMAGSAIRGDIVGAGEAAGQMALSRAMKESNSTEGLIRKGLEKLYKQSQ